MKRSHDNSKSQKHAGERRQARPPGSTQRESHYERCNTKCHNGEEACGDPANCTVVAHIIELCLNKKTKAVLKHPLGLDDNVRKDQRIGVKRTVRRVERGEKFRRKLEFVVGIGHEKRLLGPGIEHGQVRGTGHRAVSTISSIISLRLVGSGPLVVLDCVFSKPQGKIEIFWCPFDV